MGLVYTAAAVSVATVPVATVAVPAHRAGPAVRGPWRRRPEFATVVRAIKYAGVK